LCSDFWKSVRHEFWCFLRAKGFPALSDDEIFEYENSVVAYGLRKPLLLREWSFSEGGAHSDDVAVVWALADRLGLRLGRDWDWQPELGEGHFSIFYRRSPQVERLLKLLDLYHDANMVLLRVYARLNGQQLSQEMLQRLFAEEWEAWRAEKQRTEQQFLKEFEKALGKILEVKKS